MTDGKTKEMVRHLLEKEALGTSLTTDSLAYLIEIMEEHLHVESKVFPTLQNGVNLLVAGAPWIFGAITEIVPVNTITEKFDIHWVSIEDILGIGVYELALYKGLALAEIEIGRVRFAKTAVFESTLNIPMITPVIPANERISGALAEAAGAGGATVSLFYHEYP